MSTDRLEALRTHLESWDPLPGQYHPDGFDAAGKFLKENFLPESIQSMEFPTLDSFPAFGADVESLICENLISAINDTRRTINDVIRGPLKLINKMENKYFEILRDVDNLESSLINMLKSVDPPNLNITDLFNAYTDLANSCLFASTLGNMDGILQAFEDIANLAEMTTPAYKNQLIDELIGMIKEDILGVSNSSAGKILDDLINDNIGNFGQLRDMYNNMLKAAGVFDLLDNLKFLEQCIAESCRAYRGLKSAAVGTYDRYIEELGISTDPDKPADPLNMERMKKRFGESWKDVKDKASSLNRHTEDLSNGLQKIKDRPKTVVIEGLDEFFGLVV